MRDGYESTVAIFTPVSKPEGGSPLVVLLYGGGFLIGTCKDMAVWARACVTLYGATVVCPSYRLGPENKFPAAQNDVWDTLRWSIDNAASLGADPRKGFVLGGTSAGGQLSAVTAQKYVGEKLAPPLTGIWLSIPAILAHDFPPPKEYQDVFFSRDQNADAPILTSSAIDMIDEVYAMDHSSDMFSPFNAKNPHVGLPPTYFQVDGLDPLRDDGLIYERVLRAHSVTTRIDVYPGLPHSHWSFFPGLRSTVKAQTDIVKGLGWLLGQDASPDKIVHVLTPSVAL
ncbi:hypothetical protein AAFC00_001631 [Neodothiora populina]|uniref:Alpha/beta hydrolase fold-3 domain-containing protein n=1 Tax=Neodothiora populina TaxID=2781224 RepID=A0ABR3PPL8_9PEZI